MVATSVVAHADVRWPRLIVRLSRRVQLSRPNADFETGFYVIQRKYEQGITPEEARRVLEKFGKIKSCSPASPFERAAFFVNDGVVVSFQMYDMGQTAMQVRSPLPTMPLTR